MRRLPRSARWGRHRGGLRRKIFLWFGASILASVVTVTCILRITSWDGRHSYKAYHHGLETWVAARFAEVWDKPETRRALARKLANQAGVKVTVREKGQADTETRPHLPWRAGTEFPVTRDGKILGTIELRPTSHGWSGPPLQVMAALVLGCAVLWAASGWIARRITRPLTELVSVAKDLGDGKLSSRARLRCHELGEVGVLADSINTMAARIEKQLADQRELLAAVSHEIRTPLSRVRLVLELMREGRSVEQSMEDLEAEVREIDDLVGELLARSRMDFSEIRKVDLDANDLARAALSRAGLSATLLRECTDDARFQGDPALVARALANVLTNAERHGSGACALHVRRRGTDLFFEIDDAGPGFRKDELGHVFERFYRGRSSHDADTASLGLGLALVARIAALHDGAVFAENLPEGGARVGFSVRAQRLL